MDRKLFVRAIASIALYLGSGLAAFCSADEAVLRNWFDDPFFQVRNEIKQCPVPLGPLLTEAEKIAESHSRIERGTSCWLAGTCAEANAYKYDKSIAKSIQERFETSDAFKDASLWITVKRKFVWVEGCVPNATYSKQLEAYFQSVPNVERVLVDVMSSLDGRPPYAIRPQDQ